MANTRGERKFVRQQEKHFLVEKKELGELYKNETPSCLFRAPSDSFCRIFQSLPIPIPAYENSPPRAQVQERPKN